MTFIVRAGRAAVPILAACWVLAPVSASAGKYVTSEGYATTQIPVERFDNGIVSVDATVALVVHWKISTLLDEPVVQCEGGWVFLGSAKAQLKQGPQSGWRDVPPEVLSELRLMQTVVRGDVDLSAPLSLVAECDLGAMAPPGILNAAKRGLDVAEKYVRQKPNERFSYNTPGSPDWNNLLFRGSSPVPANEAKQLLKKRIRLHVGDGHLYIKEAVVDLTPLELWLGRQVTKEREDAKADADRLRAKQQSERKRRDELPGEAFWEVDDNPMTMAEDARQKQAAAILSDTGAANRLAGRNAAVPVGPSAKWIEQKRKALDGRSAQQAIEQRVAARKGPPTVPGSDPTSPSVRDRVTAMVNTLAPYELGGDKRVTKVSAWWTPEEIHPCSPRRPGCPTEEVGQDVIVIEPPRCHLYLRTEITGPYGATSSSELDLWLDDSLREHVLTGADGGGIYTQRKYANGVLDKKVYKLPVAAAGMPDAAHLSSVLVNARTLTSECQTTRVQAKQVREQPDLASAEALAREFGFTVRRTPRVPYRGPTIHLDEVRR